MTQYTKHVDPAGLSTLCFAQWATLFSVSQYLSLKIPYKPPEGMGHTVFHEHFENWSTSVCTLITRDFAHPCQGLCHDTLGRAQCSLPTKLVESHAILSSRDLIRCCCTDLTLPGPSAEAHRNTQVDGVTILFQKQMWAMWSESLGDPCRTFTSLHSCMHVHMSGPASTHLSPSALANSNGNTMHPCSPTVSGERKNQR